MASTIQDLEFSQPPLGSGTYGTVHKAYDKKRQGWIAVKTIKFDPKNARQEEYLQREIGLLQKLKHASLPLSFHSMVRLLISLVAHC
jgi:serine/threonine protein kinase